MKNVFILTCFVATLALSSCGSGDTPAYDKTLSSTTENKSAAKDSTFSDSTATSLNVAPTVAGVVTTGPTTLKTSPQPVITSQPQAAVKTAAGMNPAHGQPGHRCDIAVGAPLSSPIQTASTPAVSTPAPAITTTPSIATPSPVPSATGQRSAIPTGGTGKVNPPHGQPGHDCAIAVGAPLKN